jgi:hypothetical protein
MVGLNCRYLARWVFVFGLVFAGVQSWTTAAHAQLRSLFTSASSVFLHRVSIPVNATRSWESQSLTGVADPVMHLLCLSGTTWTQVLHNNDFSGLNARISYTNTTAAARNCILVMRARTGTTQGTATVRYSTTPQVFEDFEQSPVGGSILSGTSFHRTVGLELIVTQRPNGSLAPFLLAFSSSARTTVSGVRLGGTVSGSRLATSPSHESYLLGTVYDPELAAKARAGNVRILTNDPATDADGDGLGDLLEVDLFTCSGAAGTTCPNGRAPQDTDRDGLLDGEEILGVPGTQADLADAFALPRWGANPRQMDAFVEVDFTWPTYQAGHPLLQIAPGIAWSWLHHVLSPYRAGPADHLKNPNGLNGLIVHLDLGFDPLLAMGDPRSLATPPAAGFEYPTNDEWERWVGDMSASPNRLILEHALSVNDADTWLVIDIDDSVTVSQDCTALNASQCADALRVQLAASAPGIVFSLDPASDAAKAMLRFRPVLAGQLLNVDVLFPLGGAPRITAPTTESYQRGAYTQIPGQVDINRRGRVRYAVLGETLGQASGVAFVTGEAPSATGHVFRHELGHTLGLMHWGHEAWGGGGLECIPYYYSFMNYAYQDTPGMSLSAPPTLTGAALNAHSSTESGSFVSPYQNWLPAAAVSASPFRLFSPQNNHIDWNRSGVIEAGAHRSNPWFARKCDGRSMIRGQQVLSTTSSHGSADLSRMGQRLYAVWVDQSGLINVQSATLSADRARHSCTGGFAGLATNPCLTNWTASTLPMGPNGPPANARGVSALATNSGVAQMFVAWRTAANELRVGRYLPNAGTLTFLSLDTLPTTIASEPELVLWPSIGGVQVAVVFADQPSGECRRSIYDNTLGTWSNPSVLRDINNVPLLCSESPALSGWPDGSVDLATYPVVQVDNRSRTICGVLPALAPAANPPAVSYARFMCYDTTTDRWRDLTDQVYSGQLDSGGSWNVAVGGVFVPIVVAKASVSFQYQRKSDGSLLWPSGEDGNLVLSFRRADDGAAHVLVSNALSLWNFPQQHPLTQGVLAFSDVWRDYAQNHHAVTPTRGGFWIYEDLWMGGAMAIHRTSYDNVQRIQFAPHADGSFDIPVRAGSDFRVMEDTVCEWLSRSRVGPNVPAPALVCGLVDVDL